MDDQTVEDGGSAMSCRRPWRCYGGDRRVVQYAANPNLPGEELDRLRGIGDGEDPLMFGVECLAQ